MELIVGIFVIVFVFLILRMSWFFLFEAKFNEKKALEIENSGWGFGMWLLGKKPTHIENSLIHTKSIVGVRGRLVSQTGIRRNAKNGMWGQK